MGLPFNRVGRFGATNRLFDAAFAMGSREQFPLGHGHPSDSF